MLNEPSLTSHKKKKKEDGIYNLIFVFSIPIDLIPKLFELTKNRVELEY